MVFNYNVWNYFCPPGCINLSGQLVNDNEDRIVIRVFPAVGIGNLGFPGNKLLNFSLNIFLAHQSWAETSFSKAHLQNWIRRGGRCVLQIGTWCIRARLKEKEVLGTLASKNYSWWMICVFSAQKSSLHWRKTWQDISSSISLLCR